MVKIGGKMYIIDLDAIGNIITDKQEFKSGKLEEIETTSFYDEQGELINSQVNKREYLKGQEFDAPKYEIIKNLLDIVTAEGEDELDESLGFDRGMAKQPMSFKLAFNTLEHYKILREL